MLTLTHLRVFFLFVGLVVLCTRVESLKCGKVWDGNTRGRQIDHTLSLIKLTANWAYFKDGNKTSPIHFKYAIISHEQATPAILASGANAPVKTRCRKDDGIGNALPDTVWFRDIPDGSEEIEKWKLKLVKGQTYYFILRVEQENPPDVLYSNTHGITAGKNGTFTSFYHDDDDEFAGWKIGLITAGVAVFCLLLLLLLLIVVAKGKGEDKYTTTVHRNDNVEKF